MVHHRVSHRTSAYEGGQIGNFRVKWCFSDYLNQDELFTLCFMPLKNFF